MKKTILTTLLLVSSITLLSQEGTFSKLKIQENISIGSKAPRAFFDCNNDSFNTLKSVLARMSEGDDRGEGTFLGVRSYFTQVSQAGGKSFALEHSFYGQINGSLNFYRGPNTTGGHITISVNEGIEKFKFHTSGFYVNGLVQANEVKIVSTAWADFVFNSNYKLKPLAEVEDFIKENKHLPDIPSESEVKKNGVNLGEMQVKLLQKIEELTLYSIEQNKRLENQQKLLEKQQSQLIKLQERLNSKE